MPRHCAIFLLRRSCVLALLVLFSFSASAVKPKAAMPRSERHESRHEIDRLEQSWIDAVVHRNVNAMDDLLSDDYIAITLNGTLQSKEEALAVLRAGNVHFGSIEVSDRKVRFYGQTALVTSRVEVNGTSGDKDISGSYRYTRVYAKDGKGGWKIVSFETNRIHDPGEHK